MADDPAVAAMQDLARRRRENTQRLFEAFVAATVKSPDATTLRGLEKRFAERIGVQPSYWSQIKVGGRQIGERLARQFEQAWRKPVGWLDLDHAADAPDAAGAPSTPPTAAASAEPADAATPRDDDERFIVALVLSYTRRHPQLARTRLLQLIGEALVPTSAPSPARPPNAAARRSAAANASTPASTPTSTPASTPASASRAPTASEAEDPDAAAWRAAQAGVRALPRAPRKK